MPKLVWVDDNLLFKVMKVYDTQYVCTCTSSFISDNSLEIGDIIFVKDEYKPNSFKRLGPIKAFDTSRIPNKVIVGVMTDIGVGSKKKLERLHNQSISGEGVDETEIENDGSLYGGRKHLKRKSRRRSRRSRRY
jgi:hypothetical protein